MLEFLRKIKYHKYYQTIYNIFPNELKKEVKEIIEILPFDQDERLFNRQKVKIKNLIDDKLRFVYSNNILFKIPYRIYINEPTIESEIQLSDFQKSLLNCIYLTHHNGFVRQRRLEKIIDSKEYFIIPFTIQLLGEYVIDIFYLLEKHINNNIESYNNFSKENPEYWHQIESRMLSYWNVYYRKEITNINDYIGKKLIDKINKASL
jgi:hypothetical protein